MAPARRVLHVARVVAVVVRTVDPVDPVDLAVRAVDLAVAGTPVDLVDLAVPVMIGTREDLGVLAVPVDLAVPGGTPADRAAPAARVTGAHGLLTHSAAGTRLPGATDPLRGVGERRRGLVGVGRSRLRAGSGTQGR